MRTVKNVAGWVFALSPVIVMVLAMLFWEGA